MAASQILPSSSMQGVLHPLDSETRSKIRSTQILTSLPQIVSELVQNSLDAKASHVNIGVDVSEWECWVCDDGCGISKKGMAILAKGSIDGRYGSSKAYEIGSLDQLSTFGFRGEALASAADICCLEISSRTKAASDSWSVIVKGGKSLHYGPAIRWKRETAGTVVSVRDAFYNLPVRRKTHASSSKSLEIIKKDLQSLALVFPHVSFTLEDTSRDHHLNQARGKVMTISKTSSSLEAFRSAFGRALVEHVNMVQNHIEGATLEGFISLEGASSKAYQFLYINNRLLEPCDLHYAIDSVFARSTFGKNAFEDDGATTARSTARRSPRKNEKRPVYVLQLSLAQDTVDALLEPSKRSVHLLDREFIQDLLISSVRDFLTRHNFMPPTTSADLPEGEEEDGMRGYTGRLSEQSTIAAHVVVGPNRKRGPEEPTNFASLRDEDDGVTEWENPRTGEVFLINNRTGHSEISRPREMETAMPGRNPGLVNRRSLRSEPPTSPAEQPGWIKGILTDWENPSFKTGEREVGSHETTDVTGVSIDKTPAFKQQRKSLSKRSATVFTAEDLANAEILGQVDRKFVACVVRRHSEEGDILTLVDQHAADERVRVERFLQEYCEGALAFEDRESETMLDGVELERLQPRALVLLSMREVALLYTAEMRTYLRRWGFELDKMPDLATSGEAEGRVQVGVLEVPKLIEGKLLQGNELQDVLKSIIGDVEANGVPSWQSGGVDESTEQGAPRWLRAWRACPGSLLALVNSKACRGAIMFNDSLSKEQCSRLVLQLSQTIFPFQCAHGRPSIAPLLALDKLGEMSRKSSRLSHPSARASLRNVEWHRLKPV